MTWVLIIAFAIAFWAATILLVLVLWHRTLTERDRRESKHRG
jgi:hypothetical protein